MVPRFPMRSFGELRQEMDRMVNGLVGRMPDLSWFGLGRAEPALNVWEEADALRVEAELPGVKAEQLDVAVAGGELTLKIDRGPSGQDGVTFHRRERPVGTVVRTLRLPFDVDSERVAASLRDGVLSLTLPKAASAKPRKISVTTG